MVGPPTNLGPTIPTLPLPPDKKTITKIQSITSTKKPPSSTKNIHKSIANSTSKSTSTTSLSGSSSKIPTSKTSEELKNRFGKNARRISVTAAFRNIVCGDSWKPGLIRHDSRVDEQTYEKYMRKKGLIERENAHYAEQERQENTFSGRLKYWSNKLHLNLPGMSSYDKYSMPDSARARGEKYTNFLDITIGLVFALALYLYFT